MKRSLIALFVLAASVIQAQETLNIDQAVEIAIQNSSQVKIAQSQYKQAVELSNQARGFLGIRVDGSASYERYLDRTISFGGGQGQIDAKRATLNLSYPIDLVGVSRKAWQGANANESAALEAVNVEKNKVRLSVREAFYGVLRAEWNQQVLKEAYDAATARLEVARKRFNAGDIPKFDVLRLETEVTRAESNKLSATTAVTLSKQVLNNAMDRPIDTEFEIDTPFREIRSDSLPEVLLDEKTLAELAQQFRPELKQLALLKKAREFYTYAERSGNSPSLSFGTRYTHTIDPAFGVRANNVVFSATLSYPLWDSGITRAKIRSAKEAENQVQLSLDKTKLGIDLEIRSAVVRLTNATNQLRFARKTVELQTEALRLAELRFSAGEGILLDVTLADADLRSALGALIAARSEYLIAVAALQKAVGIDELPTTKTTTN